MRPNIASIIASGLPRHPVVFTYILIYISLCNPVTGQSPTFSEEALLRGVNVFTSPAGTSGVGLGLVDLDGDGDPDIVACSGGSDIRFFENDGQGFFTDQTITAGANNFINPGCIATGDIDGDRDLDIFVGCFNSPDRILINEGNFEFSELSWTLQVQGNSRTTGASFVDINGDQWLDLIISCGSFNGSDSWNKIYFNTGIGIFELGNIPEFNIPEPTFQILPHDFDLDGDIDFFVSNDRGYNLGFFNRLFMNTPGRLIDITASSSMNVAIDSMGMNAADVNRDGFPDIYVTNSIPGYPLLLNKGNNNFIDKASVYGVENGSVGWGTVFLDIGLDGDLDLLVADSSVSDRLYENDGILPWEDIAPEIGLDVPSFSNCWVKGDIDMDGDIDLINQSSFSYLKMFLHPNDPQSNFFRLNPVGAPPNHFAVGCRIEVFSENGSLLFSDQRVSGRNFKCHSEWIFHHGFIEGELISEVHVHYPNSQIRVFTNVPTRTEWDLPAPEILGDGNRDGQINIDDFLLLLNLRTTILNPFQSGYEFYDYDGNFIIDEADCLSFLNRSDLPQRDCNMNMENDLLDLFRGTGLDTDQDGLLDECDFDFVRGDVSGDRVVDVNDSSLFLGFLFNNQSLDCLAAADLNGDVILNITDFSLLSNYLFSQGPAPAAPFPNCGSHSAYITCEYSDCP
ncbi:FG-GAP-like repeat-containing protein [Planctomycetota bacterium]|nr:FG-GAP-like repeat-containing protein [Planctomycetota bacterium]